MSELDPMQDLLCQMRSAKTDECGMSHARRVVQIRYENGEYPVQAMGADLRECLAVALWNEAKGNNRGER